jgi:hypothetical protein
MEATANTFILLEYNKTGHPGRQSRKCINKQQLILLLQLASRHTQDGFRLSSDYIYIYKKRETHNKGLVFAVKYNCSLLTLHITVACSGNRSKPLTMKYSRFFFYVETRVIYSS